MDTSEKVMRRLMVVATSNPENPLRTLAKIRKHAVEAEGSTWGKFLSMMNKAVAPSREDIVAAFENQDLESIVEILSDSMQDLIDSIAEELGFEFEDDGDGEGYDDDEEGAADEETPGPAAPENRSDGTTVIE